jgi:Leucine-rich repeat (LRR) protein
LAEARRRIRAAKKKAAPATSLDLSGLDDLTTLPGEIAGLTALQTLRLDGNQVADLERFPV